MATRLRDECRRPLLTSTLKAFHPALYSYFAKRANDSDVDDLVQEVMTAFLMRRATSSIDNLPGYVFTIAANTLKKYLRTAGREKVGACELERQPTSDLLTPERITIGREEVERVVQAIEKLPDRTRDIFLAHRFEEATYASIARDHGISVSAVEKHVMVALKSLAGSAQCL